jgi:hypothetical protein
LLEGAPAMKLPPLEDFLSVSAENRADDSVEPALTLLLSRVSVADRVGLPSEDQPTLGTSTAATAL